MEAADASVMVWERRIEFGSVWMMMIMYVDLWHQWQEYIGMVPLLNLMVSVSYVRIVLYYNYYAVKKYAASARPT
jgi:predicted solute-binding protein